ncbi:MAG TPA: DUF2726 domain-containing protein [Oscillatoriaceae cyanobacterium]
MLKRILTALFRMLARTIVSALKQRLRESLEEAVRPSRRVAAFKVDAKPFFFSLAENNFYGMLTEACRSLDLVVFPKVGLNDIFRDKYGADRGQYFRYAQMHVDFLLVSKEDYRPVAGIELDGTSHDTAKQQARDEKKNQVFKAAGLPLMRFYNAVPQTSESIRTKVEDVLTMARV